MRVPVTEVAMPWWMMVAIAWGLACLCLTAGITRWFRILRGDFDRHYDRDE